MFSFIFERSMLSVYKMKFIVQIFFSVAIFTHATQAESFSYTAYNVSDLYSEAQQHIDNKAYDKAIERLLICRDTKRCASLLSDIYQLDDPAFRDINKSVHYQEVLFELGFKKAYHNIGFLYEKNNDISNAKKYYVKSYEAGVDESLFNLGKMYEKEKDFDKSIEIYKQASDHNISQADYALARHYYKTKDINKTQYYFEKAAKQGFKPAKKALKQLKEYLKK